MQDSLSRRFFLEPQQPLPMAAHDPAGTEHAWRREWLCLLRPAIPRGWTVIVLADRGLYAPWLLRRITRLGWHPYKNRPL